jgi:hypothetical protein
MVSEWLVKRRPVFLDQEGLSADDFGSRLIGVSFGA